MDVFEVAGIPPKSSRPLILAIGKFDGVHIGHQAILQEAHELDGAAETGVMSIWPHPAWVLANKEGYNKALTPFAEKCRLLERYGVNVLYHVQFSRAYAETTPESFVRNHLAGLSLKGVVVGSDFRFGHRGVGDAAMLEALCKEIGVPVKVVPPVVLGGQKVGSSQIREHLQNGRVEAAEALLGRPYSVQGRVVHGNHLGRTIGFPTANLDGIDEYVVPKGGVYAVSVETVTDKGTKDCFYGVLNAGVRPTVDGREFRVEVHVLGEDLDLYGKGLRVGFLRRIRDEIRFDGLAALQQQIANDVKQAEVMFGRT